MNAELFLILFLFVVTTALAVPFGKYCAKVFKGEKTWLDFLSPFETFIFKTCRIDPTAPLDWKANTKAMLILNGIFFLWAMILLTRQSFIPFWNPDGIPSMEATTAFNTAISFMT